MEIKDIEKKLWDAANQLRNNMSAEEYMHVILGVLSLKYISDKFDAILPKFHETDLKLKDISSDQFFSVYETFKVSEKSHWNYIIKYASTSEIGLKMDEAFILLEKENKMLSGIFNKNYNSESVNQQRLGEVVKIFSNENFTTTKEDIIGRIYEYFLGKFFKDRGQKGGEFYTPKSIVELIVDLIKPLKGKIYDPACGTAGMLIQAKRFIENHNGNIDDVSIYGQECNNVTWKLAKLNLILNGFQLIDNNNLGILGDKSADTFTNDQHKDSKFDYIMANPPFNIKKWGREELMNDPRWKWGVPSNGNANYAWLSHMAFKLSINGKAGIVLANGSLSSSRKEELAIRKAFIEDNKIDAIIALPDKLFYTVGIPACIWIFNNNKINNNILIIDYSNGKGNMISKKLRELTSNDIEKISNEYQKHLKGEKIEIIGFAKTINIDEIKENDYSLVPGRYVGFEEEVIDRELIKKEIKSSAEKLKTLMKEFNKLVPEVEDAIEAALKYEYEEK